MSFESARENYLPGCLLMLLISGAKVLYDRGFVSCTFGYLSGYGGAVDECSAPIECHTHIVFHTHSRNHCSVTVYD